MIDVDGREAPPLVASSPEVASTTGEESVIPVDHDGRTSVGAIGVWNEVNRHVRRLLDAAVEHRDPE